MQLFKIKVGKEITVYEDLLNQPDMTVYPNTYKIRLVALAIREIL